MKTQARPDSLDAAESHEEANSRRWQLWAAVLVAAGCAATVAYTVVETFWG